MAPIFGQNHANARLYMDISPKIEIGATNHPGKGLDPPPQTGNAQMNCYIFMVVLPLVCSNNQPVKIVKIWQFSIDIVGNVCVGDVFTWTFMSLLILSRCRSHKTVPVS